MRLFVSVFLLVTLIGCGKTDYPPVEVLASDFFIVNKDDKGKNSFVETREVPLIDGQHYGWAIAIRTNKDLIHYTEQLTLSGPGDWHVKAADFIISPDGKSVTRTLEKTGHKGLIYLCCWGVSSNDPEGKASIKVTIEGRVEQLFEFELKKPSR